jgi:DNA helicase HerA-like ATPase
MAKQEQFTKDIQAGYNFSGESVVLGCAMLNNEPVKGLLVKAPLKMFNRHGLIAGATGTGKTKTLQVIAEQLSETECPPC